MYKILRMKKTDNYGAIVKIENIVGDLSKVDENSVVMINIRDTMNWREIVFLAGLRPYNRHLSFRMIGLSCEAGEIRWVCSLSAE